MIGLFTRIVETFFEFAVKLASALVEGIIRAMTGTPKEVEPVPEEQQPPVEGEERPKLEGDDAGS